jgi:hypothetical protein
MKVMLALSSAVRAYQLGNRNFALLLGGEDKKSNTND